VGRARLPYSEKSATLEATPIVAVICFEKPSTKSGLFLDNSPPYSCLHLDLENTFCSSKLSSVSSAFCFIRLSALSKSFFKELQI
jgi:hypothetical protein